MEPLAGIFTGKSGSTGVRWVVIRVGVGVKRPNTWQLAETATYPSPAPAEAAPTVARCCG